MVLLEVCGLTVRFGGLYAVRDLNLSVEAGEIRGLIGPNGAGKSTVFNAVSRFVKPVSGTITFDGTDLLTRAPDRLAKLGIARTFQNLELFRNLSVLDNLMMGTHHRGRANIASAGLGLSTERREESELRAEALEIAEFLGIRSYVAGPARSLPYGTQKLVELGRALLTKPRLLLLDEPVARMNDAEPRELAGIIRAARDRWGISILLVEHDMSFVMGLCEKISVMNFGVLIKSGTPEEIRRDPAVILAYLGEE